MAFKNTMRVPDRVRTALALVGVVTPLRPLVGPGSIAVELSAACNFTCLMCPYHSPLADKAERTPAGLMDVELASGVISSAAKLGVGVVVFLGRGEPLLHPDLGRIIGMVKREGMRSELFTNGSLLTRKRIEEIVDAGLSLLRVSLVAASPESYSRYHPGTASETFQRVLDSLVLLQRLRRESGASAPELELCFILTERSGQEVEKMIDLANELGAGSVRLMPLKFLSFGDNASLGVSRDEERMIIDRVRELLPGSGKSGLRVNLDELTVFSDLGPISRVLPCYMGWFDARILADGTVEFCVRCDQTVGSVKESSLEDIWFGSRYQALRVLAKNPAKRPALDNCECDRCCHLYLNSRIARRLATFGLAPKIETQIRQRW